MFDAAYLLAILGNGECFAAGLYHGVGVKKMINRTVAIPTSYSMSQA